MVDAGLPPAVVLKDKVSSTNTNEADGGKRKAKRRRRYHDRRCCARSPRGSGDTGEQVRNCPSHKSSNCCLTGYSRRQDSTFMSINNELPANNSSRIPTDILAELCTAD